MNQFERVIEILRQRRDNHMLEMNAWFEDVYGEHIGDVNMVVYHRARMAEDAIIIKIIQNMLKDG